MPDIALLEKVKSAVRVTNNIFDTEITGIIAACIKDLRLSGIRIPNTPSNTDPLPEFLLDYEQDYPLIERAIILYAKVHFGFSDDSEKYQRAYDYLKRSLCLAGEFSAVE